MAMAMMLRNAARTLVTRDVLKLSSVTVRNSPILRQAANLSLLSKNGATGYLAVTGVNQNILPKVQHLQVRQAHMDHGLLWTVERAWAVALLGIIPLTVLAPSTLMDDIFAISVMIHHHWGYEAIVIDYVRPVLFGDTIPKLALMSLYLFSAVILGGLLYFNHNDIGIGRTINKFWTIRSSGAPKEVKDVVPPPEE